MSGSLTFRICSVLLLVTFAEAFLFRMASDSGTGTYNGYSSPKYKVLKKASSYELREYEQTHWVASTAEGTTKSMFMRLFRYIGGNNEDSAKIPMTVPVAIKIAPGQGTSNKYTMMFFLTKAVSPKPSDKDVFLTTLPTLKVYVRSYSGYTNDAKLKSNLEALKADVGADADLSYYYSCGYDSPWKFWNRRNEVWVLAKN